MFKIPAYPAKKSRRTLMRVGTFKGQRSARVQLVYILYMYYVDRYYIVGNDCVIVSVQCPVSNT